jgi:hypothetical protein
MKNILRTVLFLILAGAISSCTVTSAIPENNQQKVIFGLVHHLDTFGFQTGDLVLFQSLTRDGIYTQIGTGSRYTHSALIIKNEDGSLWLLHATDNEFAGQRIPVLFENGGRSGVILTKMEDSFLSTRYGKRGFYKHIRVLPFDEKWGPRPLKENLLEIYHQYKTFPFTTSKLPFVLSAFDSRIGRRDIFSVTDDNTFFCSEFVHFILVQLGYPIDNTQNHHEYTPYDIRHLRPYRYSRPVIFTFDDGLYRPKQK